MGSRFGRFLAAYATGMLVVVGLLMVGTHALYPVTEHKPISWPESLMFVVETMTTTGYGELLPFHSWAMVLWATFIILIGFATIFVLLATTASTWLSSRFQELPPLRVRRSLRDHVILTRYNPLVETLLTHLSSHRIPTVVVDADKDRVMLLRREGIDAFWGDPADPDVLRSVNVHTARALLANGSDAANSRVLLAAKRLTDIPLYSTVEDPCALRILHLAGARRVLSPKHALGESLARWLLSPVPGLFSDLTARYGFEVAEMTLRPESPLAGQTPRSLRLRSVTGATVVGIWQSGVFHMTTADSRLEARHVLVAIGSPEALERLAQLAQTSSRSLRPAGSRIVIAGFGDVGRQAHHLLSQADRQVTVIDKIPTDPDLSVRCLIGNAVEEEVLSRAHLEEASGLLVALDNDTDATYVTLLARSLSPDLRIAVRANHREEVLPLYDAGADYVISLANLGGRMLARLLIDEDPEVQTRELESRMAPIPPRLEGRTLADLDFSREEVLVLGVVQGPEETLSMASSTPLRGADNLLLVGTEEHLEQIERWLREGDSLEWRPSGAP